MRHWLIIIWLTFGTALPSLAENACYGDYKAKRDTPFGLHYGVIALDLASCASLDVARQEIARRIAVDGWDVLTVMGLFDEQALTAKRESAGEFYLRY